MWEGGREEEGVVCVSKYVLKGRKTNNPPHKGHTQVHTPQVEGRYTRERTGEQEERGKQFTNDTYE